MGQSLYFLYMLLLSISKVAEQKHFFVINTVQWNALNQHITHGSMSLGMVSICSFFSHNTMNLALWNWLLLWDMLLWKQQNHINLHMARLLYPCHLSIMSLVWAFLAVVLYILQLSHVGHTEMTDPFVLVYTNESLSTYVTFRAPFMIFI
jgi:hypothetical protein